ncbi:MAG: LPXTG cell wall anchor domain-containing protein [Clostridiaceae bacterium]|nr:LPXTG cell wall anchor domain-containing protein [Clostridiaceae bacterium]
MTNNKRKTGLFLVFLIALSFLLNIGKPVHAAEGDVIINETNFPDANFRSIVEQYDTDGDKILQVNELSVITVIDCKGGLVADEQKIADLKGIEHFTALEELNCSYNKLTSLDVSKNAALQNLICDFNQLTLLDISKNAALQNLICRYNQLVSLDVSNNSALQYLDCDSNQLSLLDVSNNAALQYLDCSSNQLTSIDVSNNVALLDLYCSNNQLSSLDVSKNVTLQNLNCSNNQIVSLDISQNAALEHLSCHRNQLTSLDISKNNALAYLYCANNQLSSLDVSKNVALLDLFCTNNQLSSLDVSNNVVLRNLSCFNNQLTSLDVKNNTELRWLGCGNNKLTSLDLSNNINLVANDEIDLSNQIYPTALFSTLNNNIYHFDLTSIPDLNIANITDVKQSDGNLLPEGVVYNKANGILTVDSSKKIKGITYDYDVKIGQNPLKRMDVTVNLAYRFNVSLNPNNGIESPQLIAEVKEGESYTYILPKLADCNFTTPAGEIFKAWEVNGIEKQPGDTVTVTEHTEIKALWEVATAPSESFEFEMLEKIVVWIMGSDQPASFTSSAEFTDFLYVLVDGKLVDETDYEVKEGSTIVSFKSRFLKALSEGQHPVEIVSKASGSSRGIGGAKGILDIRAQVASETVKVTPSSQPTKTLPRTGESSGLNQWLIVLLISAGGLLYVVRKKKVSKQ